MGTIQLDSQMPSRFGLKYVGADNTEHDLYVIHRALFGSFERFIGILIEHYGGAFPLWLAPVQVRIVPVGEDHREAAKVLAEKLGELQRRRLTTRTRRSASESGTPRSRKSRTWSSGATRNPRTLWRCGSAVASNRPSHSTSFWRSSETLLRCEPAKQGRNCSSPPEPRAHRRFNRVRLERNGPLL